MSYRYYKRFWLPKWPLNSLKVIGNHAIRQPIYDCLFVFHGNYVHSRDSSGGHLKLLSNYINSMCLMHKTCKPKPVCVCHLNVCTDSSASWLSVSELAYRQVDHKPNDPAESFHCGWASEQTQDAGLKNDKSTKLNNKYIKKQLDLPI